MQFQMEMKGRTIDLSPTASGHSSTAFSLDKQLLWYAYLPPRDWCQINLHVISTFSTGFNQPSLSLPGPAQQLSGRSHTASAHTAALPAPAAAQWFFKQSSRLPSAVMLLGALRAVHPESLAALQLC